MNGTESTADRGAVRLAWPLVRGLLLAAVIAGIFGMHALSAEDGSGSHGAVPTVGTGNDAEMTGMAMTGSGGVDGTVASSDAAGQVSAQLAVFHSDPGSGMGSGDMAGCILFLAAGIAALVLALLRGRRMIGSAEPLASAGSALTDRRRRGPPGRSRPRVSLCVIRI